MELHFEEAFLRDFITAEAARRELSGRLAGLVALREADGLETQEAFVDSAESLGLLGEARAQLEELLTPLAELEVERVTLDDVHRGIPTSRREEGRAYLSVPVGTVEEMRNVLVQLVNRAVADPEHTTVVLPIGLGGTGGCACGDELPEDEPPGPLFTAR